MVIISDKFGQLGNRLFVFAHFVANAIEFGYTVSYPGFYDYAHYFENTRNNFFCTFPTASSRIGNCKAAQCVVAAIIYKGTSWYGKLEVQADTVKMLDITSMQDTEDDYNLSDDRFIELIKASRVLFVKGWLFRDEHNFRKHAESIRRFFKPISSHNSNISRLITTARKDCAVLVGIHIRQGDYKTWLDGRYFYDTADYVNIIRQSSELWGNRRVKFLICSNEQQNEQLFEGLNCIPANNHPLEDLYSLAACDYLIGPPSTYTMWASFYGSVPLFTIETLNTPVTLEGFKDQ